MFLFQLFVANLLFRSEHAAQYLGEVFRERKVKKTYWSVAVGSPSEEEGHIRIPLKEQTVNGRFKITLSEDEISDEYVSQTDYDSKNLFVSKMCLQYL